METSKLTPGSIEHMRELLKERLDKLGSITTSDAWTLCSQYFHFSHFITHFNTIMYEMCKAEKADRIKNGLWFIYRNSIK